MYSVSDDFITAIQSNVRRTKINGFINGKKVFDENNIVKDSLKIESALWSKDISLGNMQTAKLSVEIIGNNSIAIGDEISVEWAIQTQKDYEWIPLGIFNVISVTKNGAALKIEAFDNMYKFEQDFILPELHSQNVYDWLVYICEQCGVVLGTTKEEIKNLPNYAAYGVSDADITTYRYLLSCLALITGCNAICNRNGELVLIPLKQKDSVYTLTSNQIIFNRNKTSETLVKISALYFADFNGELKGSSNGENGKVIEFERVPIIEDQVQSYHVLADNILSVASTLSFMPFEIEWSGNPALDIGDCITLPNGSTSIITSRIFKFKNTEKITATGDLEKVSISNSATPEQNALNIIDIKRKLQNYATKDDVNNIAGLSINVYCKKLTFTNAGFNIELSDGSINKFIVNTDDDDNIASVVNDTLNQTMEVVYDDGGF